MSGPEGYEVAYAVAEDNLRVGCTVIADSVYPAEGTRLKADHPSLRKRRIRILQLVAGCSNHVSERLSTMCPVWTPKGRRGTSGSAFEVEGRYAEVSTRWGGGKGGA